MESDASRFVHYYDLLFNCLFLSESLISFFKLVSPSYKLLSAENLVLFCVKMKFHNDITERDKTPSSCIQIPFCAYSVFKYCYVFIQYYIFDRIIHYTWSYLSKLILCFTIKHISHFSGR